MTSDENAGGYFVGYGTSGVSFTSDDGVFARKLIDDLRGDANDVIG